MIKLILNKKSNLQDAITLLDKSGIGALPVVTENNKFIGLITDGDIRKAILKKQLNLENIINKNPYKLNNKSTYLQRVQFLKSIKRRQLPIIDDNNNFVSLFTLDELNFNIKDNYVVLMVGGLGKRLRPLTETIPKPMLKVGDKPILETIILNISKYGFTKFILSVNYKSDIIKQYFKNGEKLGVNIEYVDENKRLGTAGALGLMKDKIDKPFIVMNGDLLTNINFEYMMEFHLSNKAIATMGIKEYDFQIPYGVINIDEIEIKKIEEKPVHKFFINAGIYVFNKEVMEFIPENKFFDMTTLFEILIKKKQKAISFPIREYWLDIGKIEEFKKANNEYDSFFEF